MTMLENRACSPNTSNKRMRTQELQLNEILCNRCRYTVAPIVFGHTSNWISITSDTISLLETLLPPLFWKSSKAASKPQHFSILFFCDMLLVGKFWLTSESSFQFGTTRFVLPLGVKKKRLFWASGGFIELHLHSPSCVFSVSLALSLSLSTAIPTNRHYGPTQLVWPVCQHGGVREGEFSKHLFIL